MGKTGENAVMVELTSNGVPRHVATMAKCGKCGHKFDLCPPHGIEAPMVLLDKRARIVGCPECLTRF
jgi:DNA-directed RNA polymerase subunit RPC12/RpoP